MQGKPLEDIVIRQWTQENNSRDNLTGIYRLFMAVMKDEESVDIRQYEFDMINTIDEKTRKKLKEGDKGDFFPFFYYNKKRLKSLHPNTD